MALTEAQRQRYERHLGLKDVDERSYEKILSARVLVVGVGGIGSAVCYYLAAAGIGHLGIMDDDVVVLGNLQRQILYATDDLGKKKVLAAKQRLEQLNPEIEVIPIDGRIDTDNVEEYVSAYDYIVAATDNFFSKFLLNDVCVMKSKPFSFGDSKRFYGKTMTVVPPESSCLRCFWLAESQLPPAGDMWNGVLGPLPGVIGALQAQDCIKYFLNVGHLYTSRIMKMNVFTGEIEVTAVVKHPQCPVCSASPTIRSLDDYEKTLPPLQQHYPEPAEASAPQPNASFPAMGTETGGFRGTAQ